MAEAQVGTPVYNRLRQQYDHVVYHSHWGDRYCYGIKKNGFAGCCDKDGKEIIPPTKYTDVSYFKDDKMFRVKNGDKVGLLDENGRVLVEADKYTSVYWRKDDRMYRVENGDKAGLLDENGRVLVEADKYTSVYWSKDDRMYKVKSGDKKGLLDEKSRVLVEPLECDIVYPYTVKKGENTGMFQFRRNEKLGLIDSKGNITFKPTKGCSISFDVGSKAAIVWQCDDRHRVTTGALYSPTGKKLLECEKCLGMISEGGVAVMKDSLWGFMDVTTGKMVVPAQYTSVTAFTNGVAKVSKGSNSFLISNPLLPGGSTVVEQLLLQNTAKSDIDKDIPRTKRVQENTFVVIWANQNYSDFVIPYAINDGAVFKEYCISTLGIPAANIMYFEDATLNNIRSGIARINDLADAYDGDASIIVYFAGQGIADNQSRQYLMPSDCNVGIVRTTAYPVQSLFDQLGELNVRSALVLLDCSFSGLNRDSKPIVPDLAISQKSIVGTLGGKLIVFMAASPGQTSFADPEKGHGIFTYYLCKKNKESKQNLSLEKLTGYVISNVNEFSSKKTGKKQTPVVFYSSPT